MLQGVRHFLFLTTHCRGSVSVPDTVLQGVRYCYWPHTTGFCFSASCCATGRSSFSVSDHTLQGFCFSAWYCATGCSPLFLTPHYRVLFQCLMLCYRAFVIVCSWPHTTGVLFQCLIMCYRVFAIVSDPTLQGSVSVLDVVLQGVRHCLFLTTQSRGSVSLPDNVLQGVRYCPWPHTTGFCVSARHCAIWRLCLIPAVSHSQYLFLCYRAFILCHMLTQCCKLLVAVSY